MSCNSSVFEMHSALLKKKIGTCINVNVFFFIAAFMIVQLPLNNATNFVYRCICVCILGVSVLSFFFEVIFPYRARVSDIEKGICFVTRMKK